jgi:radical SAM superfamily enzyme YgiQ (UPF0313 family)
MICEPLELEYLAAWLEPRGHRVTIVDLILDRQPFARILRRYAPDVVGFTAYITHVRVVREYARQVKDYDPGILTVVGGVHAEVVPEDFEDPHLDFIVHAHGLASFVAILDGAGQGKDQVRKTVPGVWNGAGKTYPPPSERFDFPHPDRSKTLRYRRRYHYIFHERCALLKTSFGCAYQCEFCFCIEIARHRYLERDLSDVIAELKGIDERNVFIVDDNFLYHADRVLEFCDRLEEAGLRKNFILFGRADFIARHPDVIRRFKTLGLQAVFLGLESFREEELKDMDKRLTVQENALALRILEEHDIERHAGIIINPDWEESDFDALAAWLRSFKMVFVNLQPLTPMPGTRTYARLKSRVVVSRERFAEWDMAHLVVRPGRLSPRRFYANILRTYYRTSAGWAGHRYVLKRYGVRTYGRVLVGALWITMQYVRMWWTAGRRESP